jgi:hypothetical protein
VPRSATKPRPLSGTKKALLAALERAVRKCPGLELRAEQVGELLGVGSDSRYRTLIHDLTELRMTGHLKARREAVGGCYVYGLPKMGAKL